MICSKLQIPSIPTKIVRKHCVDRTKLRIDDDMLIGMKMEEQK